MDTVSSKGLLFNRYQNQALEVELRKVKSELTYNNLCTQLESYLRQEQWREDDEETTWIFYQVMVLEEFKDWEELLKGFPSDILNKIDKLWVSYSNCYFGFTVQKKILNWKSLLEEANDYENYGIWKMKTFENLEKFANEVGWYESESALWKEYRSLKFNRYESEKANLPVLAYGLDVAFCSQGTLSSDYWNEKLRRVISLVYHIKI